MTIEIEDSRQEMLIKLGEQLAVAAQEEKLAREMHLQAFREIQRIENEIVRIGGDIAAARKEKVNKESEVKE